MCSRWGHCHMALLDGQGLDLAVSLRQPVHHREARKGSGLTSTLVLSCKSLLLKLELGANAVLNRQVVHQSSAGKILYGESNALEQSHLFIVLSADRRAVNYGS